MKIVSYTQKKKEEREKGDKGWVREETGEKQSILREFEFVVLYIYYIYLYSCIIFMIWIMRRLTEY